MSGHWIRSIVITLVEYAIYSMALLHSGEFIYDIKECLRKGKKLNVWKSCLTIIIEYMIMFPTIRGRCFSVACSYGMMYGEHHFSIVFSVCLSHLTWQRQGQTVSSNTFWRLVYSKFQLKCLIFYKNKQFVFEIFKSKVGTDKIAHNGKFNLQTIFENLVTEEKMLIMRNVTLFSTLFNNNAFKYRDYPYICIDVFKVVCCRFVVRGKGLKVFFQCSTHSIIAMFATLFTIHNFI